MIYFDNAATTQLSEAAMEALIDASINQYGNPSSLYSNARQARDLLEKSRLIIADCIEADPGEIFFTSGGTESDNWAIDRGSIGKNRIVTTKIEHKAVLSPVERCRNRGLDVILLTPNEACVISEKSFLESLNGEITLASIMLQNNETGTIQNIENMCKLLHDDNPKSLFHTDAVQAIGHIEINVNNLGVDLLSASAHKFNGPKGIGFLYKKQGVALPPLIEGGGQEYGYRAGTENVPAIYSMAIALKENIDLLSDNHKRIASLEEHLLTILKKNDVCFSINSCEKNRATGVLNMHLSGIDGEGLLHMLDLQGICISTGSACNSKSTVKSHVLRAMGMNDSAIESSIRISIGRYNSKDDIEELAKYITRYYRCVKGN